jgi:hypothetical protein
MKGEEAATTSPIQKVPSVSPPCHAKVTLLMKEFCDPMSAFDKPKCVFVVDQLELDQIVQNSTPVRA